MEFLSYVCTKINQNKDFHSSKSIIKMWKNNYSSSLLVYLRLSSFLLNIPYDIKRYIYEFLENRTINYMIYQTRLILLTNKPSLYLLNDIDKKYLNNINKQYISLNFKGNRFIFKKYLYESLKYIPSSSNKKNITINSDLIKKNVCNYHNDIFHLNNEKYNIDIKTTKLSKKQFLLRKHKENKKKFIEMKKIKRELTLKKKYSSYFKDIKYLSSIYINEDDEYDYQEYLIHLSNIDYYDNYSVGSYGTYDSW
jgi:hypothetical protein